MTVHGSALGYRFTVEASDGDVHSFISRALRHLVTDAVPEGGDAARFVVDGSADGDLALCKGDSIIYEGAATPALARLMNAINIGATRTADADPILHCGVAAHRDRAVLLPGRPGAGKSTTLTALLLRGFGYLSDETGPVMPDGRIRPYPKPLVVGPGSWPSVAGAAIARIDLGDQEMDAWWLDPGALSGGVVSDPLPVGAVVAPQYRAGSPLQVEHLSRAEATAVMASNTFNLAEHGRDGIERIASVTDDVPLLRLTFGDVDDACDEILRRLG